MSAPIRVGFWRPRPPSFDTLLTDAFGVAQGKAPVRSFAQTLGSMLHMGLPWPGDMVDASWDPRVRRAVAAYVRHEGFLAERYMGYAACRLCDKGDNGSADCTDGAYVWPEGLGHYLEAHSVKPPQAFVDHVVGELMRMAAGQGAQGR